MTKLRLYGLLILACLAGFAWLEISFHTSASLTGEIDICIFKKMTGLPCPSCGVTRSILLLVNGNVVDGFLENPLGIPVILIMLSAPVWIIVDFLMRKETLFLFYKKAEAFFKRKAVALPAILFVLTNWIWNIFKAL